MKILVLDNYDSFTYNLVHIIEKIGGCDVSVFRNDKIGLSQVEAYDKVVLSPGPGIPSEAGILMKLVKQYMTSKPILGVCLGHQAIAEVFGGKLINLSKVHHGVATQMKIIAKDYMFEGLPESYSVGRYHSWAVEKKSIPEDFVITAVDIEDEILAISHKKHDLKGVQFHPESILTEHGEKLMYNWLKHK
jgi:anthranilate synthase component 2